MEISINSLVVRSQNLVSAPVDDELVMADIDAGKYYGLNDIAAAIWQNLEQEISVEALCRKLCESFEVSAERCAADVMALLKQLARKNLISIVKSDRI